MSANGTSKAAKIILGALAILLSAGVMLGTYAAGRGEDREKVRALTSRVEKLEAVAPVVIRLDECMKAVRGDVAEIKQDVNYLRRRADDERAP